MALRAGRVGVRPDQVDPQGYIKGSGGGGGGGDADFVLNRYVLGTKSTGNTITLSDSYQNYDLIELTGTSNYQNIKYHMTSFLSPVDMIVGDAVGIYTDSSGATFLINSTTELQIITNTFGSDTEITVVGYKVEKEEENNE